MDKAVIKENIINSIKTVHDPEIPVNVYDLGLIYDIAVNDDGIADVTITFTTPNCPAVEMLPDQITVAAKYVEGVKDVNLIITFEPPWHQDMMSDEAKVELGLV
jgi:FeS assembly SUF system protein